MADPAIYRPLFERSLIDGLDASADDRFELMRLKVTSLGVLAHQRSGGTAAGGAAVMTLVKKRQGWPNWVKWPLMMGAVAGLNELITFCERIWQVVSPLLGH
ncbi:hypothetical protein [Pseudomonas tolaasii]|uniref:hypothetical protein n=1 Tax=Pseudomonas tolaasii TaxID=29442 RepID=UPI00036E03E0|nr:hypothetical protein [Pseudomonas tolaasii]